MDRPYLTMLYDIHCALETQSMQIPVDDPCLLVVMALCEQVAAAIDAIAAADTPPATTAHPPSA